MFIPHTIEDERAMLDSIGVDCFEDLLMRLPSSLLRPNYDLPTSMTELELSRHMDELAKRDTLAHSYLGAGAYEHFVPAAVWSLVLRGEFATTYTPYQPEASQGTLQSIHEFQSLVCELLGMEVANASMYDGASAAAEACLLALRHSSRRVVLVPTTLHPHTLRVVQTYLAQSEARVKILPCPDGVLRGDTLKRALGDDTAALLIQSPNFFGCIEDGLELSSLIHEAGGLLIASIYPTALGMLAPPGEYDADIAVAEGQPLGLPLSFGGPYVGLMACKMSLIRKMPGRLVGETVDASGQRGYVLTLQAREQHIRRERSTSNICTNQALCALASTIYMVLMGKTGFEHLAQLNFQKAHYAAAELERAGFVRVFDAPFFNEFVVRLPVSAEEAVTTLARDGILAGLPLGDYFPGRENELLICVTEIKTRKDIDDLVTMLTRACA